MSNCKKQRMIKDVREHGPEAIIRLYIHDLDAEELFRAFAIATTQQLSEYDYELLIEKIIGIFDNKDGDFENEN